MTTPEEAATAICRAQGFEFVGLKGRGAFKFTFHVRSGDRDLALKLYQKGISERSQREIEAMQRCDHPNIAKFVKLDAIAFGGATCPYLLEEYLPGGSLSEWVGRISADDVRIVARQLADATSHIAGLRLVHRDIKPDNVMLREPGSTTRPVLVDFGLVRDLNALSLTQTWQPNGPGTPFFSAPEQLNNEKGMISSLTDQFGLALTLAFVFFGEHPFTSPGDASAADAITRVAAWQAPPPHFSDACRTHGLAALLRMLQPYPIGRFRTSAELVAAWT